jgi:EAL domain-containing protein (putative c-di-GMP-specific phosphodiesterase class I)
MGSSVAIYDFGTGYSSLSYLSRFQVDKLKIDKTFIQNADTNHEDGAIVRMIVGMASLLKIQCVAEGVETADQLEFLRQCACDRIQGYYISHPLDVGNYEKFARQAGFGRG